MKFEKILLPYAKDALHPYISEETMTYHYDKHHQAYADNLNKLVENTDFADQDIETIIKTSTGALFNNAAQFWNHNFFWRCMKPQAALEPTGELAQAIDQAFGSFAEFKTKFIAAGAGNFGSGWTWLVKKSDGSLEILNTANADNPLTKPEISAILLGVDVWEHAYYIDTRNNRGAYLENFFHVIDWDFVAQNMG